MFAFLAPFPFTVQPDHCKLEGGIGREKFGGNSPTATSEDSTMGSVSHNRAANRRGKLRAHHTIAAQWLVGGLVEGGVGGLQDTRAGEWVPMTSFKHTKYFITLEEKEH